MFYWPKNLIFCKSKAIHWSNRSVPEHLFSIVLWLHDTVFSFWCNCQPCYVVLNIKKRRLKFYCDCWCPRRKNAFWKNSSPWTLTSKVNIWLGNHFFLSLRWGFNHFRCCKFFFNWSSPPLPSPPHSRPTILDKTVKKIVYLDSIFLNIVAVPVLPSFP